MINLVCESVSHRRRVVTAGGMAWMALSQTSAILSFRRVARVSVHLALSMTSLVRNIINNLRKNCSWSQIGDVVEWGEWTTRGSCSVTCGEERGLQRYTRECRSGVGCAGNDERYLWCTAGVECPIGKIRTKDFSKYNKLIKWTVTHELYNRKIVQRCS